MVGNGLAGAWALGAHKIPALRTRALWWFVAFAEIAVFGQVILGVASLNHYGLKVSDFHMFYGFLMLITIAILYAYRDQLKHRQYLLYGFGGLFVMGLGIRALLVVHR